jgi:hypothetical protein
VVLSQHVALGVSDVGAGRRVGAGADAVGSRGLEIEIDAAFGCLHTAGFCWANAHPERRTMKSRGRATLAELDELLADVLPFEHPPPSAR